jgi:hypothetical protein
VRELKKDELQAAATTLFQAVTLARRTYAGWFLRSRKPTKDELFQMIHYMKFAEGILEGEGFDFAKCEAAHDTLLNASKNLDTKNAS